VPAPQNPWGASLWTGASSSGSGVATAARLCAGALGTDTGGSIRFPSQACGVVGLKPTWGRVSRRGVFPLADSLDHIGPMARSVTDVALLLGVIAGHDPDDPTSLPAPVPDYAAEVDRGVRGLRVGYDERYCSDGLPAPIGSMLRHARDVLRDAGAEVRPVTIPPRTEVTLGWTTLCAVECALAHEATFPARRADYGPWLAALLDMGLQVSARDYARAHLARLAFAGALAPLFEQVDVLLSPATAWTSIDAPLMEQGMDAGAVDVMLAYTAPYDASGSPTLSLPGGFDERGAPFGFQLVGRHLGEALLLRAGQVYQRATDWHRRAPRLA